MPASIVLDSVLNVKALVRAFSMIVKTSPIICLRLQLYILGRHNGRNLCKQCVLANTDGPYTCRRCSIGAELSTYNCRGCRNKNPEFGEESMETLLSLKYCSGYCRAPCPEPEKIEIYTGEKLRPETGGH